MDGFLVVVRTLTTGEAFPTGGEAVVQAGLVRLTQDSPEWFFAVACMGNWKHGVSCESPNEIGCNFCQMGIIQILRQGHYRFGPNGNFA
jgi:hypothetical protein